MYKHIDLAQIKDEITIHPRRGSSRSIRVNMLCARDGCNIQFSTTMRNIDMGRKYCSRDCWLKVIGNKKIV